MYLTQWAIYYGMLSTSCWRCRCGVGRTLSVFGALGASLQSATIPWRARHRQRSLSRRQTGSCLSGYTQCTWPCRLWPRSELGVRWLVERGFTKTRLANQRERGWRSRAFQLSRGLQALPSRKTHVILVSSRLRSGFLYVRISGKLVTSGLELNVIINGWIPVEKDFVWYYTSLLGSWITPSRLRHQRLWIIRRPASHRPLAAP